MQKRFLSCFLLAFVLASCRLNAPSRQSSDLSGISSSEHASLSEEASSYSSFDRGSSTRDSSLPEEPIMDIISFPSLPSLSLSDLPTYVGTDVKNNDGSWNNDAHSQGVVLSPYFRLSLGGKETEAYGVRTAEGLHSFAMVSLKKRESVECSLSFLNSNFISSCKVLPLSSKVGFKLEKNVFTFKTSKKGSYTIILNEDYSKAFTLFVYEKQTLVSAHEEKVFFPEDHGLISFPSENLTYRFQKGSHYLDRIDFQSNCEIILEEGALLIANAPSKERETPLLDPDWAGVTRYKAFFNADSCQNIAIKGHGLIDLTPLPWHGRVGLYFSSCKNIRLEGFAMNGAPEWTLELFGCSQASIEDVALFGYRQNSDGFAIVDSDHVKVHSCFARSGDDLFEVKTMDPNLQNEVKEIIFSSCVAWPDKCRGYGVIHETKRDIKEVTYEDICLIKAPADWMDALGCLNVIVAGNSSISEITFRNVEINACAFYPINVSLTSDSSSGSISRVSFENISIPNSNPIRLLNASSNGKIDGITFSNVYRNGSKATSLSSLFLKREGTIGAVALL